MRVDPDYKIYAEELYALGHGHALFEPDPVGQGYDQVRVGDVGYIEYGTFHRLFNVCFDDEHSINDRVPEDFTVIPKELSKLGERDLEAGIYKSSSMHSVGGKFGISTPVAINLGSRVKFSCRGERGAALAVKDCAKRYDAKSKRAFKLSILNHYESWHAFTRNMLMCDVKPQDIVLVTGCDLAYEWATMTFSNMEVGAEIDFEIGVPSMASGEFRLWGKWSGSTSIPQRYGPKSHPATWNDDLSLVSDGSKLSSPQSKNQCIFVRGYRVFRRIWFLRTIWAAANPKNLERGPPHPPSGSGIATGLPANDMELIVGMDGTWEVDDVYDTMAQLMFEVSSADIVIIHDDDVCDAMSEVASYHDSPWDVSHFAEHFFVDLEESDEGLVVGQLRRLPDRTLFSQANYLSFFTVPRIIHRDPCDLMSYDSNWPMLIKDEQSDLEGRTFSSSLRSCKPPLPHGRVFQSAANIDHDKSENGAGGATEDNYDGVDSCDDDESEDKGKAKKEDSGSENDHDS